MQVSELGPMGDTANINPDLTAVSWVEEKKETKEQEANKEHEANKEQEANKELEKEVEEKKETAPTEETPLQDDDESKN